MAAAVGRTSAELRGFPDRRTRLRQSQLQFSRFPRFLGLSGDFGSAIEQDGTEKHPTKERDATSNRTTEYAINVQKGNTEMIARIDEPRSVY